MAIHYGSSSDPVYAADPADHQARLDFYGISAFPTIMIDGLYDAWPLETIPDYFSTRMAVPCHVGIGVEASEASSPSSGTLTISLSTDMGMDTEATVHAMVSESGIPGTGTFATQGVDFNYALRDNLFGSDGTTVSFSSSPETILLDVDYLVDPSWEWDQLYLTTFVQSIATAEILNSHMVRMSELLETGIGEDPAAGGMVLEAHPSPSSGLVTVHSEAPGSGGVVTLYSIDGRSCGSVSAGDGSFSIAEPGVYFVRLEAPGEVPVTQAVVVVR